MHKVQHKKGSERPESRVNHGLVSGFDLGVFLSVLHRSCSSEMGPRGPSSRPCDSLNIGLACYKSATHPLKVPEVRLKPMHAGTGQQQKEFQNGDRQEPSLVHGIFHTTAMCTIASAVHGAEHTFPIILCSRICEWIREIRRPWYLTESSRRVTPKSLVMEYGIFSGGIGNASKCCPPWGLLCDIDGRSACICRSAAAKPQSVYFSVGLCLAYTVHQLSKGRHWLQKSVGLV